MCMCQQNKCEPKVKCDLHPTSVSQKQYWNVGWWPIGLGNVMVAIDDENDVQYGCSRRQQRQGRKEVTMVSDGKRWSKKMCVDFLCGVPRRFE